MNRNEARTLLQIRRELTGENFNDATVDAWHQAFTEPLDDVRAALTRAAREHGKVTVHQVVELLPRHAPDIERREDPICIRCGLLPAEPLRTRCEYCQALVDDEVARGIHDPAMLAAVQAAHRRGRPAPDAE